MTTHTRKIAISIVGCALVLCLAPLPAAAQEDTDELEGDVVVGPQYYLDTDNRDSAKFEEFRDVPNELTAESLVLRWTPEPKWFFDFAGRDISQDDQRLASQFGKVDLWRGTIRWFENPRRWTDQAFSLFANTGDGVFTLEDSFQAAVRAATASALPAGDADLDGEWDAGTKGFVIKNATLQNARALNLRHQREDGELAFTFTPSRNWTIDLAAGRERRRGTTPQSLGMYFSLAPAEVAAQLDYRTDDVVAAAEYATRRFEVGVELGASEFDAAHESLTWDNQLFLVDEPVNANSANPAQGRMTFATDNEMTRFALRGGVNLPAHTRVTATFSSSETTQDDRFLPMTINSLLVPAPLPAVSLDGEHTRTLGQIRVSSRPAKSWRWDAWWRSFELENDSSSLTFQDTVTSDASFALCGNVNLPCDINGNDLLDDRLPRRNLPFGFQRDNLGGLVGWSPVRWFDGALSWEREDMDREHSAVESSTEDTLKLALDFDVASWLSIRASMRFQEREADGYHAHYYEESFPVGEPYVAAFNEGSRRFYWTDRDRDSFGLQFDATLSEQWSFYGEATAHDDDYFDPETGLRIGESFTVTEDRNFDGTDETYPILLAGRTNDEASSYSLGIAHTPSPRFDWYADYTVETSDYALASRYRGVTAGVGTDDPLDDWSSSMDDDNDTGSAGFHWAINDDRSWTLVTDLAYSKGTSLITTDFVPGGQSSGDTLLTAFPEVDAELTYATTRLTHRVGKNFDYTLLYWYESWEEDNFASDFNEPYMGEPNEEPAAANWALLGIDFKDYTNHLLGFFVHYSF